MNGTPAIFADAVAVTPPTNLSSLGVIDLAALSRVIDSSIASTGTNAVATVGEMPSFRGDAFPEGRRRRGNKKKIALLVTGFALAAVCVAGAVTFIRDRNREHGIASGSEHRDRLAVRTPAVTMPEPAPAAPPATAPVPPPATAPAPPDPAPPAVTAPEPKPTPPAAIAAKPTTPPAVKSKAPRKPATVKTQAKARAEKSPVVAEIKRQAPVEDGCDEVSCVLDRYKRPCCERYRPADASLKWRNGLPETLDRAMVTAGVGKMKPVVIRCGEKAGAKGTVKIAVKVAADGRVSDVSVAATPDDALGACVAAAIGRATFAKTQNGASFRYPFAF